MGLTNAPTTFQRLMEMVLRGLPWKTCLVYLDDVLIFSQTFKDHLQHLEEIFSRFKFCGLKLNPSKCSLAKSEVQFLGHIVSKDGVQPDPSNVQSVQDWPVPCSPTEVRAFLGLCSYYRKFIKKLLTMQSLSIDWQKRMLDSVGLLNVMRHLLIWSIPCLIHLLSLSQIFSSHSFCIQTPLHQLLELFLPRRKGLKKRW